MNLIFNPESETVFRGWRASDGNFDLVADPRDEIVVAGTLEDNTVDDVVITTQTGATTDHNFNVATVNENGSFRYTFTSGNEAVATVDENGHVSRVSDGTADIFVRINAALRKKISRSITREVGAETDVFKNFTTGSLARHCYDAAFSAISGKTASSATYNIYSSANDDTPAYTRNANLWASGADWTCIAAKSSAFGAKYVGVVVGTLYVLGVHHATIPSGQTMYFVTADNTVVSRTIESTAQVGSLDLQLIKLSSALPASITPCKVAPANLLTARMPGFSWQVPLVRANQFRELRVVSTFSNAGSLAINGYPSNTTLQPWHTPSVVGDSGGGIFLLVDGAPVLIGFAGGPTIHNNITAINNGMTGQTLTQSDLSEFTDFS